MSDLTTPATATPARQSPQAIYQRLVATAETALMPIIQLLARLVIAAVFWNSGRTKVEGLALKDSTFFLFEHEYQVPLLPPELAAYMATFAEHLFPVLLILGLATRFSALALLGMTLVIQLFVYPQAWVTHGLWAVGLLLLMARGAGMLSLDEVVRRRYR